MPLAAGITNQRVSIPPAPTAVVLDSEKQELTAADQFLACTSLTGIDDFYGDYYLTAWK